MDRLVGMTIGKVMIVVNILLTTTTNPTVSVTVANWQKQARSRTTSSLSHFAHWVLSSAHLRYWLSSMYVLFAIHPQNSCWLSWYHQLSRNQVNVWKVESMMGENEKMIWIQRCYSKVLNETERNTSLRILISFAFSSLGFSLAGPALSNNCRTHSPLNWLSGSLTQEAVAGDLNWCKYVSTLSPDFKCCMKELPPQFDLFLLGSCCRI